MGRFLDAERVRQAEFKRQSPYFSEVARAEGEFRGHFYPFCLPAAAPEENLFVGIRQAALDYFQGAHIPWHSGRDDKPSVHLCDSQVCCVNFLFPFASQPEALVDLLRPLFPTIVRMLPMERKRRDLVVAFEWIGACNYLGEHVRPGMRRTRGANCTSADAAVMFEHADGRRQIVLVEWKYTESYGAQSKSLGDSGKRRLEIYRRFYVTEDSPLTGLPVRYEDLFREPFYQLMRQQLLAHEMEEAGELGADEVSVLHVAPKHNTDFHRIPPPAAGREGESPAKFWSRLVRPEKRFRSVSTEHLFGKFPIERFPSLAPWWGYVASRYPWMREGAPDVDEPRQD